MDRSWLERELGAGRSIESIAREVGRPASTVAYWVRKYGLSSHHADRHAQRGGLPREALKPLVEQGFTIREVARRLGVSASSIQYWLRVHNLQTQRASGDRAVRESLRAEEGTATAECPSHGLTSFVRREGGGWRCGACRSELVSRRRRTIKAMLVAEAGGACRQCGYDRCLRALGFHHLDPATKEFGLAFRGVSRSLDRARAEARKCVLLCANCHMEIESERASLR